MSIIGDETKLNSGLFGSEGSDKVLVRDNNGGVKIFEVDVYSPEDMSLKYTISRDSIKTMSAYGGNKEFNKVHSSSYVSSDNGRGGKIVTYEMYQSTYRTSYSHPGLISVMVDVNDVWYSTKMNMTLSGLATQVPIVRIVGFDLCWYGSLTRPDGSVEAPKYHNLTPPGGVVKLIPPAEMVGYVGNVEMTAVNCSFSNKDKSTILANPSVYNGDGMIIAGPLGNIPSTPLSANTYVPFSQQPQRQLVRNQPCFGPMDWYYWNTSGSDLRCRGYFIVMQVAR